MSGHINPSQDQRLWDANTKLRDELSTLRTLLRERDEARSKALETLASALTKFAPDLMAELQIRFKQANGALDEFLAALKDTQT